MAACLELHLWTKSAAPSASWSSFLAFKGLRLIGYNSATKHYEAYWTYSRSNARPPRAEHFFPETGRRLSVARPRHPVNPSGCA